MPGGRLGLAQLRGNLVGGVAQLDSPHDHLPVRGSKPSQGLEEDIELLPHDDRLEGRRFPVPKFCERLSIGRRRRAPRIRSRTRLTTACRR